jgi:single-strand DNA-binding protein
MNKFEAVGKLHRKYETENKTGSFQAREFVLEIADGNYSQFAKFQLVQDRVALIDSFNENDELKVSFDLRGREWNGKFFTNLNAWKIEKVGGSSMTKSNSEDPGISADDLSKFNTDDDALPF